MLPRGIANPILPVLLDPADSSKMILQKFVSSFSALVLHCAESGSDLELAVTPERSSLWDVLHLEDWFPANPVEA